jgi:hypothetical protein
MKTHLLLFSLIAITSPILAQALISPAPANQLATVLTIKGSYGYRGSSTPALRTVNNANNTLTPGLSFPNEKSRVTFEALKCNVGNFHLLRRVGNQEIIFKQVPVGNRFGEKITIKTIDESYQELLKLTRESY